MPTSHHFTSTFCFLPRRQGHFVFLTSSEATGSFVCIWADYGAFLKFLPSANRIFGAQSEPSLACWYPGSSYFPPRCPLRSGNQLQTKDLIVGCRAWNHLKVQFGLLFPSWLFTALSPEGPEHPWLCGAPLLRWLCQLWRCYISRAELSALVGSLTVKQTTSSVSIAVAKRFKERHFCDSQWVIPL